MSIGKVYLAESKYIYIWELDKSHIKSRYSVISSPIFYTFYNNKVIKWHLNAYHEDLCTESTIVSLCNVNNMSIKANVHCSTCYKIDIAWKEDSHQKVFRPYEELELEVRSIKQPVLIRSGIIISKPVDKIFIKCNINIVSINNNGYEHTNDHMFGSEDIIQSDLGKLFDKSNLTDITLRTSDDEELVAHKCILAARSSVFDRMFNNDMKESCENLVLIDNISHRVLRELVRYMYTDKVEQIHDIAVDLLKAANMYDISGLVAICEGALLTRLNVDNVLDYLKMANDHNATQLKDRSIEFIASNFHSIVNEQKNIETVGNLSSPLLGEILRSVALKIKK